jgi:hypothetical protein
MKRTCVIFLTLLVHMHDIYIASSCAQNIIYGWLTDCALTLQVEHTMAD